MSNLLRVLSIGVLLALASGPVTAAFHLWDIDEIYSNADGSVQFVELHTTSSGQGVLATHELIATSDGNAVVFTIPTNVDSQTADRRLLFATPGYASQPGAVTPDFTLPANFFDPQASIISIDFDGLDVVTFSSADLPVDGVLSLNDDLSTGVNSPTNFAGELGVLSPPILDEAGYWWVLQYPALFQPPETCCVDFTGDMMDDDTLGALAAAQASLLGLDVNADIAMEFESGAVVPLIDWLALPDEGSAGDGALRVYAGSWEGPESFDIRRAGLGKFQIDLDQPAGAPNVLSGQIAADGSLSLQGDRLVLPMLSGPLGLMSPGLSQVTVEGTITRQSPQCIGPCSADLAGGDPPVAGGVEIGAVLTLDEYFGAYDSAYRQCTCAGLDPGQPVITFGENVPGMSYEVACTENVGDPGMCSDGCAGLTDFCAFISLQPSFADYDSNQNDINDAFTVGLRAGLAGAIISDCLGADCPPVSDTIFADGFEDGAGGGPSNNAPVITDQSFDVDENSPNSTVVGTVVASDPDPAAPENNLTFAIVGGSGQGVFDIGSVSGELSVADQSALDFEVSPSFDLTVLVSDGGTPRLGDAAVITVDVNDVNEEPTARDDFFLTDEDTALMANVITGGDGPDIDPDGDMLTVIQVNNVGANVGMEITLSDGSALNMSTDGSFEFTPGPMYQALAEGASAQMLFTYTVEDADGQTSEATVTIDISGVNDPPMFTGTIALEAAIVGASYDYTMPNGLVIDIDGDPLTFTSVRADQSPLPGWIAFTAATVNFAGMPLAGDRTLEFVEITATDPHMASAVLVFPLAVVDSVVQGSSAADFLSETNTTSQLSTGLEENDFQSMGDGSDIYHYRAGDGIDVVEDNGFTDTDWLFVEGHALADAGFDRFANDPDDLSITLPGGDQVILTNVLNSSSSDGIERVAFDGGEFLTMPEITNLIIGKAQTAGNDRIIGFNAAEQFNGGAGDDAIRGGSGSDTYHYAIGDGADMILDSGFQNTDEVRVTGYLIGDATISQVPGTADVLIDFGNGDSLRLSQSLNENSTHEIEQINFVDSATVLTMADLRADFLAARKTTGDDEIVGYPFTDVIDGGAGDDSLIGAGGSDIYVYRMGDGADVIREGGFKATDVLQITGYLEVDASVGFAAGSRDLLIDFGGGDSVRVVNSLEEDSTDELESIEFPGSTLDMATLRAQILDGLRTSGDDYILGFSLADSLAAGPGLDVLVGGDGSDTYSYTATNGEDVVVENGFQDTDVLNLPGYVAADATLITSDANPDAVVFDFGSGDRLTLLSALTGSRTIDQIVFDDTTWDLVTLETNTLAINGGVVLPVNAGTTGDDSIDAGPGDEVLRGLNGSDVYQFAAGDGRDIVDDNGSFDSDVLQLVGFVTGDAILRREPGLETSDLRIDLPAGDRVTLRNFLNAGSADGIETIEFTGDATLWSVADVRALLIAQDQSAGADEIVGFQGADVIDGGPGDDVATGGNGSDTYFFEAGDGLDIIEDNGSGDIDVLQIDGYLSTQVNLSRAVGFSDDLVLDTPTSDRIIIRNTLAGNFQDAIEQIEFLDDAQVWTMADVRARLLFADATAGDDVISGFSVADTIAGGTGNDVLFGLDGSDTYVFANGDGHDTIEDNGSGDNDVLQIEDYLPGDATLVQATGFADDLVIRFSATDSVRIVNTLSNNFGDALESIEFVDDPMATVWTMADVRTTLLAQLATPAGERIDGFAVADQLAGNGGEDLIVGLAGTDTYVFNAGDGSLTIQESGGFEADSVTINGHLSTDATFSRLVPGADDFVISFANGDRILLVNTWSGSVRQDTVETVTFSDDMVTFSMADIETMFLPPVP